MEYAAGRGRRTGMPLPTAASLFSAYASLSATFTLVQQAFYQFVPLRVRQYIIALFMQWFFPKPKASPDVFTLMIEEQDVLKRNEIFDACQLYLCHKMSSSANLLKVNRAPNDEAMSFKLAKGVKKYSESFQGIHLQWSFHYSSSSSAPPANNTGRYYNNPMNDKNNPSTERSYFSLVFGKEHKNVVCNSYLPFIVQTSKDILHQEKLLKLCDCNIQYNSRYHGYDDTKHSVNMTHPFTFDKLAVDPEMKKLIMDDLDRFVRRKDFYRRVGKPWKRGYLLYGPPGTGKSSLIAAMANYLKFDIYDLQLECMKNNYSGSGYSLREMLLWVPSKSIIVVEDIDCAHGLPTSRNVKATMSNDNNGPQMSLAAVLNFVDGLWSCCGDERLIVFTTNHKDKLDPALLRPGRMDMHLHMSYLTMSAFKVLAYNYLQLSTDHELFEEIESLLETVNSTPAEVAEELMRSEDSDTALKGVVELLKSKEKNTKRRKKSEAKDALVSSDGQVSSKASN